MKVGNLLEESGKTVQRYVWLAEFSDRLLDMVDKKKIGIAQGVDISFLCEKVQQWVSVILEETGVAVNASQSAKLKEYGKSDDPLKFDYYFGIEAEQFSFYRVPCLLIKDERFKGLGKPDIIYVKNFTSVQEKESEEKPANTDVSTEVKKLNFSK